MKIRRRCNADASGGRVLQAERAGAWHDLDESSESLEWLDRLAPENLDPTIGALPFVRYHSVTACSMNATGCRRRAVTQSDSCRWPTSWRVS